MDDNAKRSIVEIFFHNKSVKWKDDNNNYGRVSWE